MAAGSARRDDRPREREGARETARARHGVAGVIAPTGRFDSEALLALPALANVGGWRVVIFRGDGGRELLGDTLRERGATVDYVECYRRARPNADVEPLLKRWGRGEIDAVTVSSSEGLRNLYDMLGKLGQAWLKRTPLFAPHARIAANARALGCERVIETGPADEGLCAGLVAFLGQ
jgi:uroporphyrinogen-III synthase